jgi:RNA polymerase-binding transcription factor DksA
MVHAETTPLSVRRQVLVERKADLLARVAAVETELDAHHNTDWDDLALEREDDEVLEATGLSAQQELRRITAALHRIDEGTYGRCTTCGADIGEERLNALPYTPFCRTCAT